MSFFDINTDLFDSEPEYVEVRNTHIGLGVFSTRPYPASSLIGEIRGRIYDDPNVGDNYTFEYGEKQLDPIAPFRFLNHSCNPNCEFEMLEQPAGEGQPAKEALYLVAIRNINSGEALTIDYNWPAHNAVECECGEPDCRGWIVCVQELDVLENTIEFV